MLKQKILELVIVVLALVAIVFGVASCLFNDNVLVLRFLSFICIIFAIILNFYSNYIKKKV